MRLFHSNIIRLIGGGCGRDFAFLLLSMLIVFASSVAWCADKEPGGQGTLFSDPTNRNCFRAESPIVEEVCTEYRIKWKLWTLMGEPVGNYTLAWTLKSILFKNRGGQGERGFGAAKLPPELRKAASAIELHIDGYAAVNWGLMWHRFDTGVAVRAGGDSSYNVPGSPSWDQIFVQTSPCGRSDAPDRWSVDTKVAKEHFRNGITLSYLNLCPKSGLSELTMLESAVDKLCGNPGADRKFAFCPKHQPEEKKNIEADAIEDAFAKLEKSGNKATPAKPKSIEEGFAKLEEQRAEQERKRLAEIERIGQQLRFTNYRDGERVDRRVVELKGDTQGSGINVGLAIHFNENTQQITTNGNGEFSSKIVLKSGTNSIKVCYQERCKAMQLQADVETLALMATLTWEGRGDLDLHVETPSGETCSYQKKKATGVCMLDVDDQRGVNPENISIPLTAPKGNYRFRVVNYNGVQGVGGILRIYENERLVDMKNFTASGASNSTVISVDKMNYR